MTEPFIQWREGFVSRWINSSQLALVPDDETIPYRAGDTRSRSKLANIDSALLKLSIAAAAQSMKVEPWMIKRPSKNPDVQAARGKAAHLLLGVYKDDGTRMHTPDQVAIALDFYDVGTMLDLAANFDDDE